MKSLKDLFKKNDTDNTVTDNTPLLPEKWVMPVAGTVVALSTLSDEAFAQGMMGAGFAIKATESLICSPTDGTIASVFPGGHAIAMVADNGSELLIHIGVDSVGLKGEGFRSIVEKGAEVKAGDPLVEVDFDVLEAKLPDSAVIVVFTHIDDGEIHIENDQPVWSATA